jgi:hypothetical protein
VTGPGEQAQTVDVQTPGLVDVRSLAEAFAASGWFGLTAEDWAQMPEGR